TRSSPVQVGTDANWASVAAGYTHTVAVKTDGTLWAWGQNGYYGQLGLGDWENRAAPTPVGTDANWASAAAGHRHTAAIKTDPTLWAWGYNHSGEIGDGTTRQRNAPVQVGTEPRSVSLSTG